MNNYLTFNARAKLKRLIANAHLPESKCAGLEITASPLGGLEICFKYSKVERNAIIISSNPPVTTDILTLKQLTTASVDFDYNDQEFIIKR